MLKGIFGTLTGKYISQRRLEMISNNIANSLTPGYKASKPALNTTKDEQATSDLSVTQVVNMANVGSYIQFTEAPIVETGGKLDVAIEGDGFFVVQTREGTRYTRNGQFTLNKDKKLVTMDGNPVLGQGGEITLDGVDIDVGNDGSIYVDKVQTAVLKVVDFKDRKDLRSAGRSLFVNVNERTEETVPANYSIKQGGYEASNVDVMRELIDMISTIRAYESYTKVDQFFSDTLSKLMDLGRL